MLNEIIVDVFAGGGGASSGIACAVGRSVDVAIDHDPAAIVMHRANHPHTKHYCESVWDVDPIEVCAGRPVGLAWFSPDCKHFSKANGDRWSIIAPIRQERGKHSIASSVHSKDMGIGSNGMNSEHVTLVHRP